MGRYEQMQTKRQKQNGCPDQAIYQAGTKWPIKKKERMVEKEGVKKEDPPSPPLSEKKEEVRNVSEQRDKDWIHVIRVHDTAH